MLEDAARYEKRTYSDSIFLYGFRFRFACDPQRMQHGTNTADKTTDAEIIMLIAAAVFFVPGTTASRKKSGITTACSNLF